LRRCAVSRPVDVLAVMDAAHGALEAPLVLKAAERKRQQCALREARAAVAELVEAAATVERMATRHDGDERMFNRLRAALLKFGGAA